MDYRIETKKAFRLLGKSAPMSKDMEQNFAVVPQLWRQVAADGTLEKLTTLMKDQPMGVLGVSVCNSDDNWRYYIAVSNQNADAGALESYQVGAYTWAIFPGEGTMPDSIQAMEKRIITEWLPGSGYEYDNGPDIEVYLNADPQNAKFEIWIPVVKK